jgi:hypothetical protein
VNDYEMYQARQYMRFHCLPVAPQQSL